MSAGQRAGSRRRQQRRVTVAWAAVASASVLLWARDPWERGEGPADAASTAVDRRGAVRLFPAVVAAADGIVGAGERWPPGAAIELVTPTGDPVRLAADERGRVWVQVRGAPLGPADPEAAAGLWASLRMASSLRPIADEARSGLDLRSRGRIRVEVDGTIDELAMGGLTPDGTGVYGERSGGAGAAAAEAGTASGALVAESELAQLLELRPEAWLARRLWPVDAGAIVRVTWFEGEGAPRTVALGRDGQWRAAVGLTAEPQPSAADPPAPASVATLLAGERVRLALEALVGAPAQVLAGDAAVAPDDGAAAPWIQALDRDGALWTVTPVGASGASGDACGADEQLVRRSVGAPVCVDRRRLAPWFPADRSPPVPDGLLQPALLPYPEARVLRVEQAQPRWTLQRRGGAWALVGADDVDLPVDEPAAARWIAQLQGLVAQPLPARADDASVAAATPALQWRVITDAGVALTLTCITPPAAAPSTGPSTGPAAPADAAVAVLTAPAGGDADELGLWCRRDQGPWLRLPAAAPLVPFTPDTFASRQWLDIPPGEVVGVVIRDGGADDAGARPRQSVRLDLGAWRLDAPASPLGDSTLDLDAVEALVAAVSSLRADAPATVPAREPTRIVRIERTARREQPGAHELRLWRLADGCVGEVAAGDAADGTPGRGTAGQLPPSTCARLLADLVRPDLLAAALDRATGVRWATAGAWATAVRRAGGWTAGDADAAADAAQLARLADVAVTGLRGAGELPRGPAALRLELAGPFLLDGPTWAIDVWWPDREDEGFARLADGRGGSLVVGLAAQVDEPLEPEPDGDAG